ncbi:APC family permease [Phytomonospora endophytica]|uniref:Amino acid transporter n=1 Tax=Phytomonospora endophytica TaxID=714109 RepID=A0A841FFY1_9ACTN|nr:APC family permease [Phytomonospora endophytica]MBB6032748.1 amino acid transporter [Phytomonospora endophytica]GIG66103.1 porin [Phytomonospora endophytica]
MTHPEGIERFGYRQELRRTVGFADLMFYGLIFMVPIAPFGIFGSVFQAAHGMVALAYLVGMAAMIFTAWSYSQMVQAFPMAGSVYNYAGRGIKPPVGFLAGWSILLDYILVPSLLYVIASVAMNGIVTSVPVWAWLVGFLLLNTIVNILGIKLTMGVTRLLLLGELAVLAIFLVIGINGLIEGRGEGFSWDAFYNSDTFTWGVGFGAASVAVLSFLGFDGISMLAEESKGNARQIGRAMAGALGLAGLLFVAQTWVAAMYVPAEKAADIIANGDADGVAFYDAAQLAAGGKWLATLTLAATAIAWGFADSLVAQVATSRLLYAMSRDRQLPRFLSKVSVKHGVPTNSILLVAAVSLGVGLWAVVDADKIGDNIGTLSGLINFGAMIAFLALHVSVVWHYIGRLKSKRYFAHLVMPVIGFGILTAVVIHANLAAQIVGLCWLGLGFIVLITLYIMGRGPKLPAPITGGDSPEPDKRPAFSGESA